MQLRYGLVILVIGLLVLLPLPAQAQRYFIRGDVDCNGVVNAADVDALYGHIYLNRAINCLLTADLDASGFIDVLDYVKLMSYIESGVPEPPAPFPLCGVDPAGSVECEKPCFCAEGCCGQFTAGQTGNTDCDTVGKRNLADITRLIDKVYISKEELCCLENGNVDGDLLAKVNLADITGLIDHVYVSKAETAACE